MDTTGYYPYDTMAYPLGPMWPYVAPSSRSAIEIPGLVLEDYIR